MSREISQTSAPSIIKARAGIGPSGIKGSYEGTISSPWKTGGSTAGITVAVGPIVLPKIRKKLVKVKAGNEILKNEFKKDEAYENGRIKKGETEQQCDFDTRKVKGLSQVKINEARVPLGIRREFDPMGKNMGQGQNPYEETSLEERS